MADSALNKVEPTLNQVYKALQPDTPFGAWVEGLKQQGKLGKVQNFLDKVQGKGEKIDMSDIEFQDLMRSLSEDDKEKIFGMEPWLAITLGIVILGGAT